MKQLLAQPQAKTNKGNKDQGNKDQGNKAKDKQQVRIASIKWKLCLLL
jgi:hypothetical protein